MSDAAGVKISAISTHLHLHGAGAIATGKSLPGLALVCILSGSCESDKSSNNQMRRVSSTFQLSVNPNQGNIVF